MIRPYESPILDLITRVTVPLMQVFGLYVILHGHYSPGGGFQGGVILAVSVILQRLTFGAEESYARFSPRTGPALAAAGLLVFLGAGFAPYLLGGAFLDYAAIPAPGLEAASRRYWAILVVELGIGLGVWGALVAIFDKLTGSRI